MNNLLKFFRENPNEILNLVPKNKEQVFYEKIREAAFKNVDKGEEAALTQKQMIEICRELNRPIIQAPKFDSRIFVSFKDGFICLN